jgi:hypothetical protein
MRILGNSLINNSNKNVIKQKHKIYKAKQTAHNRPVYAAPPPRQTRQGHSQLLFKMILKTGNCLEDDAAFC